MRFGILLSVSLIFLIFGKGTVMSIEKSSGVSVIKAVQERSHPRIIFTPEVQKNVITKIENDKLAKGFYLLLKLFFELSLDYRG